MIVCVCRNIRESDYATKEELRSRVMEKEDRLCGKCLQFFSTKPKPDNINKQKEDSFYEVR